MTTNLRSIYQTCPIIKRKFTQNLFYQFYQRKTCQTQIINAQFTKHDLAKKQFTEHNLPNS
ncbi:hypothetical protein B0181_02705 [Moraxella caviae]|uniref:Uncharacterized protein n=1 Tax=Moraxella caviae TaxID=34060 RepID=A0A1T0A7H0_9GAMM|nr:hypothetical protein B0181_02705 [Moraxella caviae]